VRSISRTASQVSGIAAAAEEQSASSDAITNSLEEINRKAERTADAMLRASQFVNELVSLSRDLQTHMEKLRAQ
jgi:methyl-accepting chemotaxis protein